MRGCERRIIMLKGTSSEIFDEAYFLLRKDFKNDADENGIVDEARRIVSLNTTKRRMKNTPQKNWIFFAAGILLGGAVGVLLAIFF